MLAVWVTLPKFHSYGREFNLESKGWNIDSTWNFLGKPMGRICNWSVNSDKQLLPFLPAIKPSPLDNSIQPSKKQLLAVTRIKRDLPLKSSFFLTKFLYPHWLSGESRCCVFADRPKANTAEHLDFGSTQSLLATSPTEQWQSSSMSL